MMLYFFLTKITFTYLLLTAQYEALCYVDTTKEGKNDSLPAAAA